MKQMKVIMLCMTLLCLILFSSCGGGNDSNPVPAAPAEWDSMKWDSDKWN